MGKIKPIIRHIIQFNPGEKPKLKDKKLFLNCTSNFLGNYYLGVWKDVKNRDMSLNNYYWGVVIGDPFQEGTPSNYFGYMPEIVHKIYKKKFNNGQSTANLEYEEFKNYVFKIQYWLAKYCNLVIPDRNQVDFL